MKNKQLMSNFETQIHPRLSNLRLSPKIEKRVKSKNYLELLELTIKFIKISYFSFLYFNIMCYNRKMRKINL